MSNLIGPFLQYVIFYKYSALFTIVFFSSLIGFGFVPLNEILLAVGAFSANGSMDVVLVLAISFFSMTAADILGYFITYTWGEAILQKFHIHKNENFYKAKRYLERYAYGTIYVTRIVSPFGQWVNFIAGAIRLPFRKFLFFDVIGNASDVIFFVLSGYLAGNYWQKLLANIWIFGIIALSLFVLYLAYKTKRGKKKPDAADEGEK